AHYAYFAIWQLYFFIGLTLARYRVPLISWFYSLPKATLRTASTAIVGSAAVLIAISYLVAFSSIYSTVYNLSASGLLPMKSRLDYAYLINHKPTFDLLLGDGRLGVFRPVVTLVVFLASYILYQKYKKPLLKYTGNFVNAMGRDTLWIFAAQAIAIPIFAAL